MNKIMIDTVNKIKLIDNYMLFIYGYLFIMPWNFFKGQMGLFTVILFIWWLIKFREGISLKLRTIFEFKPLLLFILFISYTYISILWSSDFLNGFYYVNSFNKYYFLVIPFIFTSMNSAEAKISLKILILSFACYSIFSLLIYFNLFTIQETGSDSLNPKGIMAYSTSTQYMVIGSIASLFYAIFTKTKIIKVFFFILSILCFFALFVNISRTSQLSFLLSLFTIILIYYRARIFQIKSILIIIIMVVIILFTSWIILEKSNTIERYKTIYYEINTIIDKDIYEGSVGARIFFNKAGLEIFLNNPIFGTGPFDNWIEHRKIQENAHNFNHPYVSSLHSTHFEILTAFGLIGYSLLSLSIVSLLYSLRCNKEYFYIGLSFYISTFYISFANGNFFKKPINYVLIVTFILLCVIAYKEIGNKKNDSTS